MPRFRRNNQRSRDFIPLLLLFNQLQSIGLGTLPPITLILFAINVGVFYFLEEIPLNEGRLDCLFLLFI